MFTPKKENNTVPINYIDENRTIWKIYKYKCFNYLEDVTFWEIIKNIFLTISSIIITLILAYPEVWIFYFQKFFMFENMIFPKWFVVFYYIFNLKLIHDQLNWIKIKIQKQSKLLVKIKQSKSEEKDNEIFWISIQEIVKHLIEQKHFKRTDIENKFIINRNQYNKLASKLEEINILVRWENNGRILNKDYSEKQIAKALIFSEGNIDNIKIHHEEIEPNNFSTLPLNA